MRIKEIIKALILTLIILLEFIPSGLCYTIDKLSFTVIPPTCYKENNAKIKINSDSSNQNIQVQIYADSSFKKLLFDISIVQPETIIENLEPKIYYLKYLNNGTELTEVISINEPDKLEPGIIKIEKGLENINDTDAIIVASPTGGTEPYTYKWSSNIKDNQSQKAENIGIGTYFCEINDSNNCGPVRSTIFFNHITFPDYIKE